MPSKKVPEEIWRFPKIGSKKQRFLYTSESMQHPAKMDIALTRRLIKEFVPKGATLLDPMAGVGTTGVEGILLGRNVILIDIEKKFSELAQKNIANVRKRIKQNVFKPALGKATIITGDSRDLPALLKQTLQNADSVITSPPYGHDSVVHKGRSGETPCAKKKFGYADYYSDSPNNIGNLKHANGEVDAVITSPPFGEANRGGGIAKRGYQGKHGKDEKLHQRHDRPLSEDPKNISNVPFEKNIDAVLTSPPFSEAEHHYEHGLKTLGKNFKGRKAWEGKKRLSTDPKNIGALKHGQVEVVVTSPPYPEAYKTSSKSREQQAKRLPKNLLVKNPKGGGALSLFTSDKNIAAKGFLEGMPPNPRNIGNLAYQEGDGVDAVITSPPFGDIQKRDRSKERRWNENREAKKSGGCVSQSKGLQPESANNIGALPVGSIDTVITSPPFSSSLRSNPKANKKKRIDKLRQVQERNKALGKKWAISTDEALEREFQRQDGGCGEHPQNIANLPHGKVDTIITSPPYSSGIGHSLGANIGKNIPNEIRQTPSFKSKVALGLKHELIKHGCKGQIGAIIEHGNVKDLVGAEKSRQKRK